MPNFCHDKFQDYVKLMNVDEMRDYMKNLFLALDKVHSHNIIHRDIKPSNFLYNREKKKYVLVDFGLAQRLSYLKNKENHNEDITRKKRKRIENQENETMKTTSPSKKRQAMNDVSNTFLPLTSSSCLLQDMERSHSHYRLNKTLFVHSLNSKTVKMNFDKMRDISKNRCSCFGKQEVCKICLHRAQEVAPRAGTPGFRAPEVLLKYQNQTTAVDMWAAGVIFLSLLTKKYPFFRASDDLSSLAEITCIVGSKRLQQAAQHIGKRILLSMQKPKVDFKLLCEKIRMMQSPCDDMQNLIPESAYHLLGRLLDPNPFTRITARQACAHQFITAMN